jgi:hypothetical protein
MRSTSMRSSSGPGMVSSTLRAPGARVSLGRPPAGGRRTRGGPALRARSRAPRCPPQAQGRAGLQRRRQSNVAQTPRQTAAAALLRACIDAHPHGMGWFLERAPRGGGGGRALGGAHEEHAGQVDRHVQVVVQEARVLLRVQQLQQRAGRVARVTCARPRAREQKTKPCDTAGSRRQARPVG